MALAARAAVTREPPVTDRDPGSAAADAVTALYRACHLPPPAVLVARDAVDFARLVDVLARRERVGFFFLAVFLGVILACLAAVPWLNAEAARLVAFHAGLLSLVMPPLLRLERSERGITGPRVPWPVQILLLVGLGLAVFYGLRPFVGRSGSLTTAAMAIASVVAVQIAAALADPLLWRLSLRSCASPHAAPLRRRSLVRGPASIEPVLLPRLQGALAEPGIIAPAPRLVIPASVAPDTTVWPTIETELRRRRGFVPHLDPLLGRALPPLGPLWMLRSLPGEAGLPRLLQAACALDRLNEAACLLHGAAVVLPAGMPDRAPLPAPVTGSRWRRSRRAPWRTALVPFEASWAWLAIDLLPTDHLAARWLARRLVRLPEAHRRTPALEALGLARVAAALRSAPVQEDAAGRLFLFGSREDSSLFVAVRDKVLDAHGEPLEHWISVPPHVATAREAVAWSFGLAEAEYQPSQEA